MVTIKALGVRIKLEKRVETPWYISVIVPIASILIAILISMFLIALAGKDPIAVYTTVISDSFSISSTTGYPDRLLNVFKFTIPLALVSIGLTISFIAKFWNIGGEGQLLIGEVAAFWVYIQFVDVAAYKAMDIPSADKVFFGDTTSTLIMMVIAAFFAGGVWALIPAILKSRWGVNEILTTIMMNYVVLSAILPALIYGPWREPKYLFGRSIEVPTYMRLDALRYVPEQGYTLNPVYLGMLCLIVAAAIVMTFVLYRTKIGYEVRVVGDNPKVAKTAGIRVGLVYSLGMFISGGLAGMAGVAFLLINGFMDPLLSPGYGYTGIVAAWLGNLHPATTLLAAIFISYLSVLGDIMEGPRIKLPKALTTAVVATILLGLVMFEIFRRYRVRIIRIPSRR